ncbi:ABC transporter permease [Nocardioides sp. Kera G14]|uniref:ABC transporter permease n=1 Tax=Nocardioides sp. Kera G14 TaxID=2884264 RepID=UPI001D121DD9|nr:ABC transporter permease [Nocardioides sp. Kera G14]UDY24698.1 ABC transporter permease [Nocardioides sp. Kera G14]
MIAYLGRRIANYVVLTAVASCLAYVLASLTLNPAAQMEGRHPRPPQHTIDLFLDGMGVNPHDPLWQRTLHWFAGVIHGDFGIGVNNQSVAHQMWVRMGISLEMLLVGSILGTLLGIALGVWGAMRQYKLSDNVVTTASYVIFAAPTFVLGILAMIITTKLNHAIGHTVITFSGPKSAIVDGGFWPHVWDRISHLLLPSIVLILMTAASFSRYQRASMLDVLDADYIRTARAKGLRQGAATLRHGVRVALIPMAVFFAYSIGLLVTGSLFLEVIFGWDGMGQYAIRTLQQSDINGIAGTTCYIAVLTLISSTLSEILFVALDPRARL